MALVTGVVAAQAMLGGLVAQTPMAILNQLVGWRHAMLINASFGVLIFLAILFIVQDYPAGKQGQIAVNQSQVKNLGLFPILKQVALNPYNWLGGIYASLLNLPVFLLGALWGIDYLVQVHHLTLIQASVSTTLFFVGTIIGAPLFGWFSDYIGRRVLPLMLGAVLSIIAMLVLILTPHLSFVAITALFFLIGIVICSQAVAYPTIAELNPPAFTATALGFASTLIMLSGAIFQPLFGRVMEWSNFTCAMFIMPIAFGMGFLIALMIKETYCGNNL
jgi:sugar phosphate permease